MEIMYCGSQSLSEFLNDDDGYNSDDLYEYCNCGVVLDFASIIAVIPSPPLSPCEEKLSDTTDMVDKSIPHQLSVVACGCPMCANASGPLIKDCMWSAGAPVPVASSCVTCPDSSSTSVQGLIMDLETSNTFVKNEMDTTKSDACDDQAVCARLAEYRHTGSAGHLTVGKTTKSSKVVAVRSNHWISGELLDDLSQSGDESSEEIDVVSVTPRKASSCKEKNLLVLPALASVSEQVAALHNYSSPVVQLTSNCNLSYIAACSTQSSPGHHRQKQNKIRCSSPSPTSKRALWFRKYKQLRKMRLANSFSDSEDSGSSLLQSSDEFSQEVGGKRSMHNVLERRRRSCLKLNFHSLRDVVPSISGNSKMSKVTILKSAHSYMMRLIKEGQLLHAEMNQLRSLNQRWQRKLALLTV